MSMCVIYNLRSVTGGSTGVVVVTGAGVVVAWVGVIVVTGAGEKGKEIVH